MSRTLSTNGLFFLACLPLLACGKPAPPDDPPPEIPPLADITPPDVPDVARLDLAAPSAAPLLRWDAGRLHSYRLREEVASTLIARFIGPVALENAKARYEQGRQALAGQLRSEGRAPGEIERLLAEEDRKFRQWLAEPQEKSEAKIRSDGFADFDFTSRTGIGRLRWKLSMREYVRNGAPQGVNDRPPAKFEAQVEENGHVFDVQAENGPAGTPLLDVLFALPAGPLAVGESVEREIAVVEKGERPAQRGRARTTFTGYAKVDRYECARLETLVDLDVTPVRPAEGRGRSRARVVAWFAVVERRFVRIDAAVLTSLRTRSKVAPPDGPAVWSVGTSDVLTRFSAEISDLR